MAGRRATRGGNVEVRISVRECDLRHLGQLLLTHEAAEPDKPAGVVPPYPTPWETWREERSRLHTRIIETTRDLGKLVRERDAKRAAADRAAL